MKLTTLKPRIATIRTERIAPRTRPDVTPRQRGRAWVERRARWLSEHPLCVHCENAGRVSAADEVDHVVPLWSGGADDETNLQSLCSPCHKLKTALEASARG